MSDEVDSQEKLDDLDEMDVFNDEKGAEVEVKTEEVETPEVEAKTEENGETPAPENDEVKGLKAAIKAERQKRQEAQQELKKLQGEAKSPDPVTDPDNFNQHLDDKVEGGDFMTLVKMSANLMRSQHDDYDDMELKFLESISEQDEDGGYTVNDQKVYSQYRNSDNPAEFAYNYAKRQTEIEKRLSPDYEKNLEKEIEDRILDKLQKQGVTQLPDLTNAAASQSNNELERIEDNPDDISEVWRD